MDDERREGLGSRTQMKGSVSLGRKTEEARIGWQLLQGEASPGVCLTETYLLVFLESSLELSADSVFHGP